MLCNSDVMCDVDCLTHLTMSDLVYGLLKVEIVVLLRGLNEHSRTALQLKVCFDA